METAVGCANIGQYSDILFQRNFGKTGLAEMGPEGKLCKNILAEFTVGLKAFWTKMKKQNKTTTALVKPYTMPHGGPL